MGDDVPQAKTRESIALCVDEQRDGFIHAHVAASLFETVLQDDIQFRMQ